MTSHVLLEGILDVKDPRGSEVRKFWKAWRSQWVSFSVIYPSGRREPHLLLKLSHCSSEIPERHIRLQREGLRIFRCRSKSRPYRTWAIMSGNKLVLYFAAESEMQAQLWMKELRDGLWPPCFSFQMLTACSHEVSLIDDENTFLSGLLGTYGRFVLTSEDVISLMHPYWGCTLLQISLSSVQDVLFVRQAEIAAAGVFSIVLKRDETSKVKTLQFFCSTAMDAIQWILNKIHLKSIEKSNESTESNFPEKLSILVSDDIVCLKSRPTDNLELRSTNSTHLNTPLSNEKISDPYINADHSNTDYENLQYLKINPHLNSGDGIIGNYISTTECSVKSKWNNFPSTGEHASWSPPKTIESPIHKETKNEDTQFLINTLSNSEINKVNTNFTNETGSILKSQNYSNYNANNIIASKDLSTKCKRLTSNEDTELKQEYATENDNLNSGIYSKLNKKNAASKDSYKGKLKLKFSVNDLFNTESNINNHLSESKDPKLDDLSLKSDYREADCSLTTSTKNLISDHLPADLRTENEIPAYSNIDFFSEGKVSTVHSLNTTNSPAFGIVKKQISSNSASETMQTVKVSQNSFSSNKHFKGENNNLLPNISSEVLNTGFTNSVKYKSKTNSNSSSNEDTEILPWVIDEFTNLDIDEGIYEDILDRKGTIYEEIDSSESDSECAFQHPPSLPERPQNLEIPNSLRLQKLSKNIERTLETSDRLVQPTKGYPRPAFIKKIKDVSRIMQISPTQESSREPFSVETKLPMNIDKNKFVLKPTINSPQVKTDSVQNKNGAIRKYKC